MSHGDGMSRQNLSRRKRARSVNKLGGATRVAAVDHAGVLVGMAFSAPTVYDPAVGLGRSIDHALDPARAPGKVKTFADMTDEERAEMRRLYERKK